MLHGLMTHGENQARTDRTNCRKVTATCATVVGITSVIIFFTPVWAILTQPRGRDVPRTAPNEDNRIYHPFGFSIVAPPHWRAHVDLWEDPLPPFSTGISMSPERPIPSRYSASLGVFYLEGTPPKDLAAYSAVTFQGQPAFERRSFLPDQGFENPGQFSYTLAFERDKRWYRIGFHRFTDAQQLPPEIQAYVNSFRTHNRPGPRVDPRQ